ncbi:MAG: SDR family oxidoreductase [Actinomycetia bacterium]|nr:SDR family oxidoreductase [Actinomycetes bacterium]MCP4959861.1 SDR family oxidoreductase [Actinomycetes bacterium]
MTSRVALVTGGAGGIGREVCVALAADDRRVAVADINTEGAEETAEMIRAQGGEALVVTMDITDSDSVIQGCLMVADEMGPVEILVNVAGWDRFAKFLDTDEELWDLLIEINYKGVLRTTHACLPAMVAGGWGRIVNIASDAGRVGSSLEAVYSGAKGAVIAFSKTIAREVARSGVTVNSVCPGPTDTALLASAADSAANPERMLGALEGAVPMKRLGQPSDIAPAVVYFASEGSAFTTGQTVSVSGGLTMAG